MISGTSADTLRRDFDAAFALPVGTDAPEVVDLLSIRVAGEPYALRVAELGGIATGRRVTPVPSPEPAFAGLVGIRGATSAVFDLAVLLGAPQNTLERRWVVLAAGDAELALAFEELEGHLRLPAAVLAAHEHAGGGFCERAVRTGNELRPVVSIPRIVAVVLERAAQRRPGKSGKNDG